MKPKSVHKVSNQATFFETQIRSCDGSMWWWRWWFMLCVRHVYDMVMLCCSYVSAIFMLMVCMSYLSVMLMVCLCYAHVWSTLRYAHNIMLCQCYFHGVRTSCWRHVVLMQIGSFLHRVWFDFELIFGQISQNLGIIFTLVLKSFAERRAKRGGGSRWWWRWWQWWWWAVGFQLSSHASICFQIYQR